MEQPEVSVHSAALRQLIPEALGLPRSKHGTVWARAYLKVGHVVQLASGCVTDLSHLDLGPFYLHLLPFTIAQSQIRPGDLQVSTNPIIFGNLGFHCQLIILVQTFLVRAPDGSGKPEVGTIGQCQGLGLYELG